MHLAWGSVKEYVHIAMRQTGGRNRVETALGGSRPGAHVSRAITLCGIPRS
jgi:hypothetical protein